MFGNKLEKTSAEQREQFEIKKNIKQIQTFTGKGNSGTVGNNSKMFPAVPQGNKGNTPL